MAKIVTSKDCATLAENALMEYRKDVDIESQDLEAIFIDGFVAAFNLNKLPSKDALRNIFYIAFKGENVDINKALDRIKEHYKL